MNQVTAATSIDNDDLTCPITLEPFRDPVRAKDGHVYEREAITRWIFEHGTSPFTREPLQTIDLQPDDRLRRLAAQRRNSTVSFNARNNTVTLSPLRLPSRNIVQAAPEQNFNPVVVNNPRKCSYYRLICVMIIFVGIGVIVATFVGIIVSAQSSSKSSSIFFISYR